MDRHIIFYTPLSLNYDAGQYILHKEFIIISQKINAFTTYP